MKFKLINPKYYLSKLSDVGHFIINPNAQLIENRTTIHKLTDLFIILFITLVISVPIHYLNNYLFHPKSSHVIFEMRQKLGPIYFFFFSVCLIPVIEESAYRLSLVFTPAFFTISFALFAHRIISRNIFSVSPFDTNLYPFVRLMFAFISALLFYLLINRKKTIEIIKIIWSKHFKWIFYGSSLLFAFMHLGNYKSSTQILLLAPILTLPQLFFGLTAGYMRIKYGFIYPVLLHALFNSSQYWLVFLLPHVA